MRLPLIFLLIVILPACASGHGGSPSQGAVV
jgi:hypothetical protein